MPGSCSSRSENYWKEMSEAIDTDQSIVLLVAKVTLIGGKSVMNVY